MKTLAFMFVTAAASLAFAYPAVKDQAVFKGLYSGAAGGAIDFVQTLELTAFDSATNSFKLKNTFLVNGQAQVQEQDVAKDDLLDDARIQDILTNCLSYGGQLEDTTTVGGTFKTCTAPTQGNGRIWIGDVPFGMVKSLSFDQDQNKIETELQSFVRGQ